MAYNPNNPNGQATMANSAPVVIASNQSNVPVIATDTTASISIGANSTSSGSCTSPGGASVYTFQLTGTWTATVQVQVTRDGSTWVNLSGGYVVYNLGTGQMLPGGSITSNGIYQVNISGVSAARVITTAYTSGTVGGSACITSGTTPTTNIASISGALTLSSASVTTLSPRVNLGTSVYSGSVTNTATAVKATTGQLYGYEIHNSNTSAVYIQLFNATAANVTVGTTTPFMSIGIPASTSVRIEYSMGVAFGTAISLAATTTRTGNTAPSNTVDVNITYS